MNQPLLYQINTRTILHECSRALGRRAQLDDVSDALLDEIAANGFGWIWLLGVWQTGPAGRGVSLADERLRAHCRAVLPDLTDDDITGSPFAVRGYRVHEQFGGDAALYALRERMRVRGLRLLLDFVPNHVAPDHPFVDSHPEYFIQGGEADLRSQPQNYTRVRTASGRTLILAHGRDPYFDGWQDTLQLNYRHVGLREAQLAELAAIAERCDGVRCDMAMLLEPDVFARTWGERARPADGSPPSDLPFWPEATAAIRRLHPEFTFIAEVYWGREWQLQQQGFDYTYDKELYDRLRGRQARPVREHLWATPDYQNHSLRFLENHDEPRAAATFEWPVHQAAAVISFLVPGMHLVHEGQLEGRKLHVSMHLGRRPSERAEGEVAAFYDRLLRVLRRPEVHEGRWRLRDVRQAWSGNPTHEQFIAMTWTHAERVLLVVANYAGNQGQCYVPLELPAAMGQTVVLADLLRPLEYRRNSDELRGQGLYLDLAPWGHHVFELRGDRGAR